MSVKRRDFNKLLLGAVTGLLVGVQTGSVYAAEAADEGSVYAAEAADEGGDKHACKGMNDCKGQGGCASGDNGCFGKNSCKGLGGCGTSA